MTERRNDIIDSFRAYSIVCVMVCHYVGRPDQYGYHVGHDYLWQIPRHAVDVFFVISGFVISMTVLRTNTATEFLYKRFARLFPSLLVCSLITFCFTRIVGPSGRVVSPVDFGFSLLLISRKVGISGFTDAVYWTLALEAEFYILVAASFWFFRKRFWIGVLLGTLVGLTGRYMGFFLIGMTLNGIPLYEGLALASSFSIALAALIHYGVEMPANAALRGVLLRFSPSPAQVRPPCHKG